MGDRILIAGATGSLGRETARALRERGHYVIAMGRDPRRLAALSGVVDEVRVADALRPETLTTVCDGVDRVFSCMGASVIPMPRYGRATFTRLDTPANTHLVNVAVQAKVRKFVYVSVFGAERLPHMDFVQGHERVVEVLRESGLDYGVLRPTGFFQAMLEILTVASRGLMPQFANGTPRTNPIHEADLAEVCADALYDDIRERDVGGPEALTRREIAELAFAAVGKQGRFIPVPVSALKTAGLLMRPISPRVGNLFTFIADILVDDFVAPAYGSRRIADFFAERCRAAPLTTSQG